MEDVVQPTVSFLRWLFMAHPRLRALLKKSRMVRPYACKYELEWRLATYDVESFIRCATTGQLGNVELFLDAGMDVNVTDARGVTAMVAACARNQQAVVDRLRKAGASDDGKNVARLKLADKGLKLTSDDFLASRDAETTRLFLQAGMDIESHDHDGNTPLISAARCADPAVLELLLDKRVSVHATNDHGDTALIVAARAGHTDAVKVLMERHGTDRKLIDHRNRDDESAWIAAVRSGARAVELVLENHKADNCGVEPCRHRMKLGDAFTPAGMLQATRSRDLDRMQSFLLGGMNPDEPRDAGADTPLLLAAAMADEKPAAALLQAGADPRARNAIGDTALIIAARHGREKTVNHLLKVPLGAFTINCRNDAGESALLEAARRDFANIVKTLRAAGAEEPELERKVARWQLERDCRWNETGFLRAVQQGDRPLVEKYLLAGMSINATNERDETALIVATGAARTDLIAFLLAQPGIDLAARASGSSAADRAARANRPDLVNLLSAAGVPLDQFASAGLQFTREVFLSLCKTGRVERVEQFLDAGMDPNASDDAGRFALIEAARTGHQETVELLLARGADPDLRDARDDSARSVMAKGEEAEIEEPPVTNIVEPARDVTGTGLLAAAAIGDRDRVSQLLLGRIDTEVTDPAGNTPLAVAAARGWTAVMDLLIESGAKLDAANVKGDTPLMQAARCGRVAAVEKLLGSDAKTRRQLARAVNLRGETALLQAAIGGHGSIVALLAPVTDEPDTAAGGRTALVEMCHQGDIEAVQALIDALADVNQRQVEYGESPLMTAILAGRSSIVELLEKNGAWAGEAEAEIFRKVFNGDEAGLRAMKLRDGVEINARDRNGMTALMIAASEGNAGVVQFLLDKDADAALKTPEGGTSALSLAASKGRTAALDLLIGKTERDETADTAALLAAASAGHAEAVRLLATKTEARIDGFAGRSVPLIAAAVNGHVQVVKTLLELKADPDREHPKGITALKAALFHEQQDVVYLLMQRGDSSSTKEVKLLVAAGKGDLAEIERLFKLDAPPTLDTRDESGRTPLMRACANGHAKVVDLLLERYQAEKKIGMAVQENDFAKRTPLIWAATAGAAAIVSRLLKLDAQAWATARHGRNALLEACVAGSLQSVRLLLNTLGDDTEAIRAAVDYADESGHTPLSEAMAQRHPERREYDSIVKLLLDKGATAGREVAEFVAALRNDDVAALGQLAAKIDIHTFRHEGKTPLMIAVEAGRQAAAAYLIGRGADINDRAANGNTALILAAQKSSRAMIDMLLEKGAAVDLADNNGDTALLQAIRAGRDECVKALIDGRANVNAIDDSQNTALLVAVERQNLNVVRWILNSDRKIDLDVRNAEKQTASSIAHLRGRKTGLTAARLPGDPSLLTPMEKLLIDAGARTGWDDAELIAAIRDDDMCWAEQLVATADVNARDFDGNTPLLLACAGGHLALTQSLLKQKANPEARNDSDRTALMEAAKRGSLPLVDALLAAHPTLVVDAKDEDGESALLEAAAAKAFNVVERLLGHCASPNVATQSGGETALIRVARYDAPDTVRALIGAGANVCARTSDHRTAIIEAAKNGHLATLTLLLDQLQTKLQGQRRKLAAIINAVDDEACTALDWATRNGNDDCAKLLAARGGKPVAAGNLIVYTTPSGDCYHTFRCGAVNIAKQQNQLTQWLLWKARKDYEICGHCRAGQDAELAEWVC